ncbi:MAG: hypothetical protein HXK30_01070 [Atopobium sp.]|nr:hypothetical protein [Atopobium sp.]
MKLINNENTSKADYIVAALLVLNTAIHFYPEAFPYSQQISACIFAFIFLLQIFRIVKFKERKTITYALLVLSLTASIALLLN